MSRVANNPVEIPTGVEVTISDSEVSAKSGKITMLQKIHHAVAVIKEDNLLKISAKDGADKADAYAGTMRALLANIMHGLTKGFEKKLTLVGVGYRAQLQGNKLLLTLGFSHPVEYELPAGISAELPSQTEVVIKGADKQVVGQVAADIRAYRPPEPYKGKGIRYADEHVVRKEGKKK